MHILGSGTQYACLTPNYAVECFVAAPSRYDAIVVGAGISGLYLLHRLRSMGLSVLVLDQATGIGGTWFWNRYPGARCDIESMTYSYSWSHELEQEWTWSERYAGQAEILAYLEHVADRFDLRRDIRLGTRVAEAALEEPGDRWSIATDDGERFSAGFLIMATGCLSVPRIPDIPGIERFAGELHHTGLWPHEGVEFAGKRVGVIGTGSSAVQAIPLIAAEAAQLTVFQRTANFSVPAWNGPLTAEIVSERKARYEVFRRVARTTTAGNPWNAREQSVWDATPEEREREFEERYASAGSACTRPTPTSSRIRRRTSCVRVHPRQDPRARARPRARRAALPLRPSARHEADVRRHRLFRDLQPPQRAPGLDPREADRRDHRDAGCASATRSSRSTRSCSAPVSMR